MRDENFHKFWLYLSQHWHVGMTVYDASALMSIQLVWYLYL